MIVELFRSRHDLPSLQRPRPKSSCSTFRPSRYEARLWSGPTFPAPPQLRPDLIAFPGGSGTKLTQAYGAPRVP
jgi:hypothetical protein